MGILESFKVPESRKERWHPRENVCYKAEHAGQVVCADGMKDVGLLGGALDSLKCYRQTGEANKCPTCFGREAAG
jgi:hypothetical protein